MKFRFRLTEDGNDFFTTWRDEVDRLTAPAAMGSLRAEYPNAAISIERSHVPPTPKPRLYRYDIAVRQGVITVVDDDGEQQRNVSGMTLQSGLFQIAEHERVLVELQAAFPDAQLTMREVRGG